MNRATPRRRIALAFTLDELLDALDRAGVAFRPDAHLVTVVHRPELDQVLVIVDGPGYPTVEPGSEPDRYDARDVQRGLRVVAERAAAAVDMALVPRPVPGATCSLIASCRAPDGHAGLHDIGPSRPPAELGPLEGDGGIGVGMGVSG